jgi:hypothetical protein
MIFEECSTPTFDGFMTHTLQVLRNYCLGHCDLVLGVATLPRELCPCIGCCVHALGVVTLALGVVTCLGCCDMHWEL